MLPRLLLGSIIVLVGVSAGCKTPSGGAPGIAPEYAASIHLLMPRTVALENFTQPISTTGDGRADSIEAIVRTRDSGGHDIKVVGTFQFELYKLREGTTERVPARIAYWRVPLDTQEAYNKYWSPYGQNYRFHLTLENPPLPSGQYELHVQLTTPEGEHLFHQREIKYAGGPVLPSERRY